MVHWFRPMLGSAAALVLLIGLSGCGSPAFDSRTVTLNDAPAANLEVVLQVTDDDPGPQVNALFYITRSQPMDTQVEFAGDETMTCGKTTLARTGGSANPKLVGNIASVKPGQTVSCVYSSNGVQTALSFLIPPNLVMLSPKDCLPQTNCVGVPRDKPLVITYQPAAPQYGTGSVMAEAQSPATNPFGGGTTIYSALQPDTGKCQFNISRMPTGNDFNLTLYRELDTTAAHTNFQSLTVVYLQDYLINFNVV